ncbi:patatin-like phospholipase family protein [Congregibacter sp.]|uniref:patatin-like phospholipase family protein n=1 Tax=Congregibacter sp. TaxID=2744308 RepID=UPI003F6A6B82
MSEKSIPINLVLGSGGARGLTHIGVVKVLEERGFHIRSITGCSMGALVGALWVSGHLNEYDKWVRQLTRWDVFRFLDISLLGRAGMVKGDKLMERLEDWLGGVQMESLPVPLTVVAADIASRKEVWISQGDLLEAVRASIAVPGVFTPLVKHGRVLVDGGILNPLPIPPARMDGSTITVAVSLSGREVLHPMGNEPSGDTDATELQTSGVTTQRDDGELTEDPHSAIDGFLDNLQRFFGRDSDVSNRSSSNGIGEEKQGDVRSPPQQASATVVPALTDVMLGMFNTMQDTIARHQLAGNPPDILIDIPCNICESHEFHRASELVPAGEYWARKALDEQRERFS